MKPSRLFVLVPVLALTLACATQPRVSTARTDHDRIKELIDREERLTLAIAQGKRAVVNDLLAKDFRCAVADHPWFRFDREPSRGAACTGFGHEWARETVRPEWLHAFQNQAPRVATIDDMAVKLTERGAVVVSLQTYTNWLPYSGPRPKRSRVTDHWILDDGEWRLAQRFSEPLAANAVASLLPR
ncbi:MAG TPA: nuclear transport factor 2 family protein [Thermoanaerobaculia bacterium]